MTRAVQERKILRLRTTIMSGVFVDDQGRAWIRDNRDEPGSQQPELLMRVCGRCAQPAPIMYLLFRSSKVLPEARCGRCVRLEPGGGGADAKPLVAAQEGDQ